MKRSFVEEDGGKDTVEKQPRITNNNEDLSVLQENVSVETSATLNAHTNTLKERNAETEISGDLPSLNDSSVNIALTDSFVRCVLDPVAENVNLKNQIDELEATIKKLKDDNSFLKKQYSAASKFKKKERNKISDVYTEKNQNFQRAVNAEERITELGKQLSKSQSMVQKKDSQRLEVQLELNKAQEQCSVEKAAKEKALRDIEELQSELKKAQTNKSKNDGSSNSTERDTVAGKELQQSIETIDPLILGLQERLQKAFAVQENLKDEKREAVSEMDIYKKQNTGLRDTVKLSNEKIAKLENEIEDLHEKLCQRKNDMEQESYEVSCENDSLKIKIEQFRETIKEKNQLIAQFQKDLNVGQVLQEEKENAEIEKAKAETKLAEEKLENLIKEYNDMKAQKENELVIAAAKIKELESKIKSLEDNVNALNTDISKIKDEKIEVLADLEISRVHEEQRTTELEKEKRAHEKSKEDHEDFNQRAKDFIKKAHAEVAVVKNETATKIAELEALLSQCQKSLTSEFENRRELEGQIENIKKQLSDEILAKEKAFNDLKESEAQVTKIQVELLDLKEQQNQWQQKCEQIQAELQTEKESAANKYQKLEEKIKKIKESKEKVEIEFAKSQKEWNEKKKELQEFVQKFNSFCKK